MEDGLATHEIEATENLSKNEQRKINQSIELMERPLEDDAEDERRGWAGWNG